MPTLWDYPPPPDFPRSGAVSGEKTEKPTARRRKESRKEGQVPRTQELGGWASLLAVGIALPTLLTRELDALRDLMVSCLTLGDQATPENLSAALDLGYLATDGGEIVHISRRLLDVSAALVREGIPLADVLATGRQVRTHAEALATLFTDLILNHPDHTPEDL